MERGEGVHSVLSDMCKCNFRETREAYLKCNLEKVKYVAARLQRYLHVGCYKENVCTSKRPLHLYLLLPSYHWIVLGQIHDILSFQKYLVKV